MFFNFENGPALTFYSSREDHQPKLIAHWQAGGRPWVITLEPGDVRQLRDFCRAWLEEVKLQPMTDPKPTPGEDPETVSAMAEIKTCPHCGADFTGGPIRETHREHFGGKTHFSRLIAVSDRELDRCTHYQCPDCGKRIELG